MFKGLFGKVLNCKNEINKKKEENKGQENWKGCFQLYNVFFLLIAKKDKNRIGYCPPPPFKKSS